MRHRHPSLRRPISEEQFLSEFQAVWALVPIGRQLPGPVVTFCDQLSRTHAKNCRRYAEVDPRRRRFYFAHEVRLLPRAQRLGLVGHEIGHFLDPMGSERDADEASRQQLGVVVSYSKAWPGKGLQTGRYA